MTLWGWIASLFGAGGVAAVAWLAVERLRAQGARRAEIRARVEASRRAGELARVDREHAAEVDAARRALAATAAERREVGPTRTALADLHRRTREPWPPDGGSR